MKRGRPKSLIIAAIGAVVWIFSAVTGLYIQITSIPFHPTFEEAIEPHSPAPFFTCLVISGIGFVVLVISGIKYILDRSAHRLDK
ncbi:hypothetical protein GCM10008018_54150 [Paenibacillus marchantiophytorum]|uniref:Uncharacterized protein n=1 Tax=Paenibacillus marchantiophytorum TaxID=1619310 RepID=A0ABQ1F5Y9_9BACL|nr:hypothetical protein [Paenibacillus marchantiophytorum]GGA01017.1 hypothetical protein GCM10008018_54150 [Paenibacillus marchantiophytorum]